MKLRFALLGCVLSIVCTARAGTISSTFGPGDSYSLGLGWGAVGPAELAYPFTVPSDSNYSFQSASLALSEGIGSDDLVTISLATNAGGVPGTSLETFSAVVEPYPNDTVPVTVTSILNPQLTAGSVYWLIVYATSGNGVNWQTANILTTPDLQATRSDQSSAWTASALLYGYNNPGALSINADATSAVPEGSTWALCMIGIASLACIRSVVCSLSTKA